jgi:hypothetical protein
MKMLWIFLILWLGLAGTLIGCGVFTLMNQPQLGQYTYTHKSTNEGVPTRFVPIWIDKDFGAADLVAIDDAVNAWNYSLNGYVKLKIVDTQFDMEIDKIVTQVKSNGWLIMKIDGSNAMVPAQKEPGMRTVGFCERVGGNHLYLVRDRLMNEDVFGVTMHEMGHLLGSGHVGDHLMYPTYSRARFQCVDEKTLEQVANYNHIPLDRLNYCVDSTGTAPVKDKKEDSISCPTVE